LKIIPGKESRINLSKPNARTLCLHRCFLLHDINIFLIFRIFFAVQFAFFFTVNRFFFEFFFTVNRFFFEIVSKPNE